MIEEVVADELAGIARAVSVVIPAFNEGEHVAAQVIAVREMLQRSGWSHEILVVDDGSQDQTAAEADSTGARVLRRPRNRGYGAALKLGIRHAKYDWILITDAMTPTRSRPFPRCSPPPSATRWWSAPGSAPRSRFRWPGVPRSGSSPDWPAIWQASACPTSTPDCG